MQKDKVQIIRQEHKSPCWVCDGLGNTYDRNRDVIEFCKTCNGTGLYTETYYIHIANGIAIDGDTLK